MNTRRLGSLSPIAALCSSILCGAVLASGAAYGYQTPSVEEQALRTRVEQFYTALQEGDWLKAEGYLADGSKPIFRQESKQKLDSFEIKTIKIDPSGETATVVVELPVSFPNAPGMKPFEKTTRWRLVNKVWLAELPKPDPQASPSLSHAMHDDVNFRLPAASARRSKALEFAITTDNIGEMRAGHPAVARFRFKNSSSQVVRLTDVQLGCDCLKLTTSQREFQPGESGTLEFDLDTSGMQVSVREAFSQTVVVKTEPGGYVDLTVAAILLPGDLAPARR